MAIEVCAKCGARNRVDERVTVIGKRPVCGRCGASLSGEATGETRAGGGDGDDAAARPRVVTDASFERDVIARSQSAPVLLDFWAAWCAPCRMIAPALEQLASESGGRYLVAKLNVDENPQTASRFDIRSIPTLIIFKGGQPVERIVGAQSKQTLAARLAAHV